MSMRYEVYKPKMVSRVMTIFMIFMAFCVVAPLFAGVEYASASLAYSTLGDFVWNDLNRNGIQDAGESGIANVQVGLWDVANNHPHNLIATTTTNGSGLYLFNYLIPQDYAIQFILPPGTTFAPQKQGGNPARDSDANPSTGFTNILTLGSGEVNLTVDAGIFPIPLPGTIWLLASGLLGFGGLRRLRRR